MKIRCTDHDLRVVLIPKEDTCYAVHRSDGSRCGASTVRFGDRTIEMDYVLIYGASIAVRTHLREYGV